MSYTAKQAFLARDDDKTTLYMQNGLIQSMNIETQILSTTKFESVAIDLSTAIKKQSSTRIYLSHVPTWLMLQDSDKKVGLITNVHKSWINLELHNRIQTATLLLCRSHSRFCMFIIGNYTRFGLSKQISLALFTIVLIKLIESYASQLVISNHLYWPAIYLPSLFGIFMSTGLLIVSSIKFKLKLRG